MVLNDLNELPPVPELAVIINVGTKYVTTLALLSALRFAQMPLVVLDCQSQDGSFQWFENLLHHYDFSLMRAKLRRHGETLDWIFRTVRSERVLLVDSDVEVLNAE